MAPLETAKEVAKALRACGALTPEETRDLDATLAAFREVLRATSRSGAGAEPAAHGHGRMVTK